MASSPQDISLENLNVVNISALPGVTVGDIESYRFTANALFAQQVDVDNLIANGTMTFDQGLSAGNARFDALESASSVDAEDVNVNSGTLTPARGLFMNTLTGDPVFTARGILSALGASTIVPITGNTVSIAGPITATGGIRSSNIEGTPSLTLSDVDLGSGVSITGTVDLAGSNATGIGTATLNSLVVQTGLQIGSTSQAGQVVRCTDNVGTAGFASAAGNSALVADVTIGSSQTLIISTTSSITVTLENALMEVYLSSGAYPDGEAMNVILSSPGNLIYPGGGETFATPSAPFLYLIIGTGTGVFQIINLI